MAETAGKDPATGRFTKGNKVAAGNSAMPRKTKAFRELLLRSVSRDDFRGIVASLVTCAKAGESWAVKEALRLLVGNASDVELHQRLMQLENAIPQGKK